VAARHSRVAWNALCPVFETGHLLADRNPAGRPRRQAPAGRQFFRDATGGTYGRPFSLHSRPSARCGAKTDRVPSHFKWRNRTAPTRPRRSLLGEWRRPAQKPSAQPSARCSISGQLIIAGSTTTWFRGGDLVRHRTFATLMVLKNHEKIRVAILGPGDANSPARDIARRTPPGLTRGYAPKGRNYLTDYSTYD